MKITVKITGLDGLIEALQRLAPHGACSCTEEQPEPKAPAVETPAPPAPQPDPTAAAPTVPTVEEVAYSFEALQRAAASVARNGKRTELQGVLQELGLTSLVELQPAQYNAFATRLRELGGVL